MTTLAPIRRDGGMVDFNGNGLGGCASCGWRGVPTFVAGVASTFCPRCEREPDPTPQVRLRSPQRAGKPSRNAPCPCGSGVKSKKCCGR